MITLFGSLAVGVMFIAYWLEQRSRWYLLVFAGGAAATSAYSGLVQAYPVTVIEAVWAFVAIRRFLSRSTAEAVVG